MRQRLLLFHQLLLLRKIRLFSHKNLLQLVICFIFERIALKAEPPTLLTKPAFAVPFPTVPTFVIKCLLEVFNSETLSLKSATAVNNGSIVATFDSHLSIVHYF